MDMSQSTPLCISSQQYFFYLFARYYLHLASVNFQCHTLTLSWNGYEHISAEKKNGIVRNGSRPVFDMHFKGLKGPKVKTLPPCTLRPHG